MTTLERDPHARSFVVAYETSLRPGLEGAEVEVLKGAERLVREMHPKILVENHLFKRSTIGQEVRALLARLDYREVSTVPYHAVSHSLFE